MVGVWEGLNLGSIPNDHMPSQKDPKIPIERRCSTILPLYRTASSTEYVLFRTAIGIHNGPRDRYHICPDRQKHDGCHYYQLIRSLETGCG